MPILWGVPPPPRLPRSWIRLVAPQEGGKVLVARIGPLVGLMTHWVKPKTVACTGSADCPVHDAPQTWKGFGPCVTATGNVVDGKCSWREAVAVITEGLAEEWATLPLGSPVFLSRRGSKKNAPLIMEPAKLARIDPLPPSFDVKPYVLRAMGWPDDFAGQLRIAR